jgi:hypothetical protein
LRYAEHVLENRGRDGEDRGEDFEDSILGPNDEVAAVQPDIFAALYHVVVHVRRKGDSERSMLQPQGDDDRSGQETPATAGDSDLD